MADVAGWALWPGDRGVSLLMLSVLGDVVQDEVYLVTEGVGGGVVIGVCVVRM